MATVAGLYKYNSLNDSIVGFSEVDGLSNSNVKALEIDNQGLNLDVNRQWYFCLQ